MAYRSERLDVGKATGLGQVFSAIDKLETSGIAVEDEVMAGTSYRRQLHPDTLNAGIHVNYLIQATFAAPRPAEGKITPARTFIDYAAEKLSHMDLPGDVTLDEGTFQGFDATKHPFGSTGYTEYDTTQIYPPWIKAQWTHNGRSGLFLCGIHPPQPKRILDDYIYNWDVRQMRQGRIVFKDTPKNL